MSYQDIQTERNWEADPLPRPGPLGSAIQKVCDRVMELPMLKSRRQKHYRRLADRGLLGPY